LSVLNLESNNLGEPVLPGGWEEDYEEEGYLHDDGRRQLEHPGTSGAVVIGNAIESNRGLTELRLENNHIPEVQRIGIQEVCNAKGIRLAV
jgi:hypothetical protein